MLATEPEDLSDAEGNDESSAYELWTPPPSAMPEYEYSCGIEEIQWFHGCLPRENAEKRLANDGDFLVREHRQTNDKVEYIISVFWKGPRHFKYQKSLYTQPHNPVEYYVGNEVPITETTGVLLRNPILRESWEIRNNDIELQNKCDSEDFGDVYIGLLKSVNEKVSVHLAREDMTEEDRKMFLGEAQILCQIQHPNIVKYFGIAMDFDPVMVVMEHITGISLLTFLRDNYSVDAIRKLEICIDVANAIDYLQEKKWIHRNIAARSCAFGDGGAVKLAAFSLCSKLDPLRSSSRRFAVPVKWTAPEVLSTDDYLNSFCLKSDIWSFGVLLWEVYSNGKIPYPGWRNQETVDNILQGHRLPAPKDTAPFIAEIIARCWNEEPNRRPNIKHILQWLKSASKSPDIENFKLPPLPPPAPSRTIPPPPVRSLPLPPLPGRRDTIPSEKNLAARNSSPPPLPHGEDKKRPLPPPPPASKEGANKLAEEFERKLQRRPPPPIPTEVDEGSDDDIDFYG